MVLEVIYIVKVKENMTGWVMKEHGVPNSRLTILRQAEDYINSNTGIHTAQWWCQCECGSDPFVTTGGRLKDKKHPTVSCGCYNKEVNIKRLKQCNVFSELLLDEYGEYYIGWTHNTNREFYIDAQDYHNVKDWCWSEVKGDGTNFARIQARVNGKTVLMHIYLGYSNYDHIDRNELNNRKYNLRPCTVSQNNMNKSVRSDNTSEITGVYFDTQRIKWVAGLQVDNKCKYLERFDNKEDAIRARLKAELEYFKEFAPQRHLFEEYGISINTEE